MKRHFLLLAVLALAGLSPAADSLDTAIRKLEPSASNPVPTAQSLTSIFSYGLLDKNNVIRLSAWEGGLKVQGDVFNNFQTTLAFTEPTANRTITFPDSSGTVVYNPVAGTYVFEGDTADAFETTLAVVDPTADGTIWFPDLGVGLADTNVSVVLSTINSGLNAPGLATAVWTGVSSIVFEAATADAHEGVIDFADVTADVIYRFPDAAAATYGIMPSALATNGVGIANSVTGGSNVLNFEGTVDAHEITLTAADATADGTTTGTISAGVTHVTVTSDSADKIVILPSPVVGKQIVVDVGATGFELRSSAPETIAINGGTGAAAESAIAANSTCVLICVSATAWKGYFMDADGDVAKIEAAAAP